MSCHVRPPSCMADRMLWKKLSRIQVPCQETQPESSEYCVSKVATCYTVYNHVEPIIQHKIWNLQPAPSGFYISRYIECPIVQGIGGYGGLRISDNLIYPLYCSHMIYDVDLENGIRKLQSCAILLAYNVSIVGFLIFFYSCYDLTQSCQQFQ